MGRGSSKTCAIATAFAMVAVACSVGTDKNAVLRIYRLTKAQHDLTEPTWLASTTSDEVAGSLSPDGSQLVFSANTKGQFDIWRKDLTTGDVRRITRHDAEDTQPAWHPDGKRIAFISMRQDAKGDLYLWDGKLSRLTDAQTADTYPVFAADGRSIFFASGAFDRSRIERLWLDSKRREPVSPWGATHPSVSADGKYLAYTLFNARGRGQVMLQQLSDNKRWVVTSADYHSGFPTFDQASQDLLFCRFFRGPPESSRDADSVASLWRVPLSAVLSQSEPSSRMRSAEQLTSDRRGVLMPHAHRRGIVLTVLGIRSMEIGLLPESGAIPQTVSGKRILALARATNDDWDRLLMLRHLWRDSTYATEALYRSSETLLRVHEYEKAAQVLRRLVDGVSNDRWTQRARIDQIVFAATKNGGEAEAKRALRAIAALPRATDPAVAAYTELRRADMHIIANNPQDALAAYQRVTTQYPEQQECAAQALLRAGVVYARTQDLVTVADYYAGLFDRVSNPIVLRAAARAALRQFAPLTVKEQVEAIRAWLDRHRNHALLLLLATQKLAQLYEQTNQNALAILALHQGLSHYSAADDISASSAFAIGRLSLAHANALREKGRYGEALAYYDKALSGYERILNAYDKASAVYQRAWTEFVRLSLLDAAQLSRQGEYASAKKRYRRILARDAEILQAVRGELRIELRTVSLVTVRDRWKKRQKDDQSDFVATYALGYLATMVSKPTAADLNRAERWLTRAIALRPQNPFAHMTLGWVHEMRERLLQKKDGGWLEEAILEYNRAYELNDPGLDPQTEADLLLNLTNAFVALGGNWPEALSQCKRRAKLNMPFESGSQEAYHHLVCGRAASATHAYDEANTRLERALQIARTLNRPHLRSEILARLAVNEHMRGNFGASTKLLKQVESAATQAQQLTQLSALQRTVAYNALLANDKKSTQNALDNAETVLKQYGALAPPSILPVVTTPDPSTAPLGFDVTTEQLAIASFREIVQQNNTRWDRSVGETRQRIELQKKRMAHAPNDTERFRELLLLYNELAAAELRLGNINDANEALHNAFELAQSHREPVETLDVESFAIEVALAIDAATLTRIKRGGALQRIAEDRKLNALERVRDEWTTANKKALLSERLRLALWAHIAVDSLSKKKSLAKTFESPTIEENLKINLPAFAVAKLQQQLLPVSTALSYWQRVVDATGESPSDDIPPAKQRGPTAPLWQPLTAQERARWHVAAVLNMARIATLFTPTSALATHASTEALKQAAAATLDRPIGLYRFALAAEIAYRQSDLRAMQHALDGMVDIHPLLYSGTTRREASALRDMVVNRTATLALAQNRPDVALEAIESGEQVAFVADLFALHPRASKPGLREALIDLDRQVKEYRRVLAEPDQRSSSSETEAVATQPSPVQLAKHRIRDRLGALIKKWPQIEQLITPQPFSAKTFQTLLAPDACAIRAANVGGAAILFTIRNGEPVQAMTLKLSVAQLRQNLPQALQTIQKRVAKAMSGVSVLYVDLGSIAPALSDQFRPKGVTVVQLATLSELAAARAARRPVGKSITAQASSVATLERAAERADTLMLTAPVRFAGGPNSNITVTFPNVSGGTTKPWRLPYTIGTALRFGFVLLQDIRFSEAKWRQQRVALMRLFHAMGIANVATACGNGGPVANTVQKRLSMLNGTALPVMAKTEKLCLFGDGGLAPDARQKFAKSALKSNVFGGAKAFKTKQLAPAVEYLERALQMAHYLNEQKYLAGTLLFLANAYGLQEDYPRAVRHMARLVALRDSELKKLKRENATPATQLKAKANYVTALRQMAWLRLRNEQYAQALDANEKSIAIYEAVGRSQLTRAAYAQRSVIAEKAKKRDEALKFARKDLTVAMALAKHPKATPAARIAAAEAALRVALLERQQFSRFEAALEATKTAQIQIPKPELDQCKKLNAELVALQGELSNAKGDTAISKKAAEVQQQLKPITAVVTTYHNLLLERARIQTAKGLYAAAVKSAKQARELAAIARLPEDAAVLEIVNNLYYVGDYRQALDVSTRALEQTKDDSRRQIQLLNAQGTVLAALGQFEQALNALTQALKLAKTAQIEGEVAATYNNIGNALRLAGRVRAARNSFNAALLIDRRRKDQLGISFDLANRGLSLMLSGLQTEAAADLQEALRISKAIGAPLNQLKAFDGLARIALSASHAKTALEYAQQGRELAKRLGLRNWLWRFYLHCGRALRLLRKPKQAESQLRSGVEVVYEQPPRLRPIQLNSAHGNAPIEDQPEALYDELIDLLAVRGRAEASLGVLQQLQARRFVDMAGLQALELPWKEARAQIQTIIALQRELEAARCALLRATKAEKADETLVLRVTALQDQIDRARSELDMLNPRLAELITPREAPIGLIKQALAQRKNSAAISMYATGDHLLVWLLKHDSATPNAKDVSVKVAPVKVELYASKLSRGDIVSTISAYRRRLTNFHDVIDVARKLYDTLLKRAISHTSVKRLILAPAGVLQLVPFAALHDGADYLIKQRELTYVVALSSLVADVSKQHVRSRTQTATKRMPWVSFSWAGDPTQPAPFTVYESDALSRSVERATVRQADQATVLSFLESANQSVNLHLATHGVFDENDPLLTAFRLHDGSIRPLDLLGQNMQANLIVLSACSTGLGSPAAGFAVSAVAHALRIAGARQVVDTLWRNSDLGAALLMKGFFRNVATTQDAVAALQSAQVNLMRRYPHPAFWAGFRIVE